ncbi:hypothetical protein BpHYR1_031060 [Brachionus plicatilis]|uniref:Uncharacterized protein n=1 Tax=Brachionus plicatilis TaxID=10195 RepID=A0A3M7RXU3_BRAPC|nr:hypothetical protein BpHYR1_031060 [Brachionus plicatilis]
MNVDENNTLNESFYSISLSRNFVPNRDSYILQYIIQANVVLLLLLVRPLLYYIMCVKAAKHLFNKLLRSVLSKKYNFFMENTEEFAKLHYFNKLILFFLLRWLGMKLFEKIWFIKKTVNGAEASLCVISIPADFMLRGSVPEVEPSHIQDEAHVCPVVPLRNHRHSEERVDDRAYLPGEPPIIIKVTSY